MTHHLAIASPLLALALLLQPLFAATSHGEQGGETSYGKVLVQEINRYRQVQRLAGLRLDVHLNQLALEHSTAMAEGKTLSHDQFDRRFRQAGSRLCVENVGWNSPTPRRQLTAWQNSSDHDRNMLIPRISRVGIANVDGYVTFFACE